MKKKPSWKAMIGIRLTLALGALGAGAVFIRAELARASDLDQEIRSKSEQASLRLEHGEEARIFWEKEESILLGVAKKIEESVPAEAHDFKAFCVAEAEAESIELSVLRCEKQSAEAKKTPPRGERSGSANSEKAPPSDLWSELPFSLRGEGSYGAIMRFSDRIYSSRILVAIDKFGIARSSLFDKSFADSRNSTPTPEAAPEGHSFLIEGRIFLRNLEEKEEAK